MNYHLLKMVKTCPINRPRERVEERTNGSERAQRRQPPEGDKYPSGKDREMSPGIIGIIDGRDSAARWSDHGQHRQGGCTIGRRGMTVTGAGIRKQPRTPNYFFCDLCNPNSRIISPFSLKPSSTIFGYSSPLA